jgi:hypothetical protein
MRRVAGLTLSLILSTAGVASPLPGDPQISLTELVPLNTWRKQFKIIEGRDRGKVVPLIMGGVHSTDDRRRLTFGDYASILMVSDSQGGFAMERLDLIKGRSHIIYNPPLPILPRDLASGQAVEYRATFKMYDSQTGRLKRSGSATHQLKQISHSRFVTPAGVIDGYNIAIDHRMDMPYAKLQITLGVGCRPDEGPVYGSGEYTLTKLGLFTETKTVAAGVVRN